MINTKLVLCTFLLAGSACGMEEEPIPAPGIQEDIILLKPAGGMQEKNGREKAAVKFQILRNQYIQHYRTSSLDGLVNWILKHKNFQILDRFLLKELADQGASINGYWEDEATPLHIVCEQGEIGLIKLFLEYGADVTSTNNGGPSKYTPLHILCTDESCNAAILAGDDLIALFIAHGADINAKDAKGLTPLSFAISAQHLPVCLRLLCHGAIFSEDVSKWLLHEIATSSAEEQDFYANFWLDQQREPYFIAALLSLRKLEVFPQEIIRKILSHVPELIPNRCLPKYYHDAALAQVLALREQEKADLIQEMKVCKEVIK